ncbi:energy transducer TonB [Marinobacter sp.]|uniref:energy transducer TonB family protein n=1 Tax=Marinobacter sp. TaxID=50741 RepID=UPI001A0C8504|nr:energy transducer TonB [Marinobacter sp.]MBE0485623.1 energy transducer TonB [Marinobacter sp.]
MRLKRRFLLAGVLCAVLFHVWAFSALQNALMQRQTQELAADEGEGGIFVSLAAADFAVPGNPADAEEPEPVPEPDPVPAPEPETPVPEPEVQPEPEPATLPEPVPTPEPEPAPEPEPTPEPEPAPPSNPELTQSPVSDPSPSQATETVQAEAANEASARESDTGGSVAEENRYLQDLLGHLNRYKRYPDSARRMRREGVVTVTFTVSEGGRVNGVQITDSSGFRPLDDEVRQMLARAAPLPVIPAHLGQSSLTVTLPVAFTLQR